MELKKNDLKDKKCIPCSGTIPPLKPEEIEKNCSLIHGDWKLTHHNTRLYREFPFKNFAKPMELANIIGEMAEEEGHHPELQVGWGHLGVEVWTHKINALVESDFIFAAKVDEIFKNFEGRI